MAFQIKDFLSIVASCVNQMRGTQDRITDFNIGSVARTLIEAPAIEIDELYQQMFHGLKESIPVAIYRSFDFTKLAAEPASGLVRVTITPTNKMTLLSAGTTFSLASSPTRFISRVDTQISPNASYADVVVAADSSGASTNILSGMSFAVSPQPAGFLSAINAVAFTNGRDLETDDQQKSRFVSFVASLNHGTIAAIRYGLLTAALTDASGAVVERVKHCSIVEPYVNNPSQPIGLVECYIHNGYSSASAALVARAVEVVHGYYDAHGNAVAGWKAAGVKVDIFAVQEVDLNITATLTTKSGFLASALSPIVQSAVASYISSIEIGGTAYLAGITSAVMDLVGVENFVIASPSLDAPTSVWQKLMPGVITINYAA